MKITIKKIFWYLLCFLPFADSLNGYLNGGGNEGGLSFGIIYRIVIILISLYYLYIMKLSKRNLIYIIMFITSICVASLRGIDTIDSFVLIVFKLLLPILLVIVFEEGERKKRFDLNYIQSIFDFWSVAFPLTIFVPYILGIGFNTYGMGAAGYKGFYFAQNDIGLVLALLYMYAFYKLNDKVSTLNILRLTLLLISNLVLGLKSNYLYVIVITIVYLLKIDYKAKKIIAKIIALAAIILGGMLIIRHFSDQIDMIINRWMFFYNEKAGVSFWTSSRIDRVTPAYIWMMSKHGILNFLFGTGMDYTKHTVLLGTNIIEMDFFDLFFQLGIVGVVEILLFYGRFINIKRIKSFYTLGVLLSILSGALAGHVFESALSGMVFSMVCVGTIYERKE